MVGCLLRASQPRQHVHEGHEEGRGKEIAADVDELVEAELSLGGTMMDGGVECVGGGVS